jgi:hypothetical protein
MQAKRMKNECRSYSRGLGFLVAETVGHRSQEKLPALEPFLVVLQLQVRDCALRNRAWSDEQDDLMELFNFNLTPPQPLSNSATLKNKEIEDANAARAYDLHVHNSG